MVQQKDLHKDFNTLLTSMTLNQHTLEKIEEFKLNYKGIEEFEKL